MKYSGLFQVKFHPTSANRLASGSTDGLVCTFDISQTSEEDAILSTLNSESSVVCTIEVNNFF